MALTLASRILITMDVILLLHKTYANNQIYILLSSSALMMNVSTIASNIVIMLLKYLSVITSLVFANPSLSPAPSKVFDQSSCMSFRPGREHAYSMSSGFVELRSY